MAYPMRLILVPFIALLATAAPAIAGETAWQEVSPGVHLRLVSTGQIKANGTTLVGLEIDMAETTKTYWRVPGEAGLPTQLDFAGSTGVDGHQVLWPYPTRVEEEGYLDYVYFGPTVLPIEVTVSGDAPQAELAVMLGVCSEICVPAQARFSLPLHEAEPDRANGLRIRQALAMTPLPWDGDPQPIGNVEHWVEDDVLAIWVSDPDLDALSLIAATASGSPVFGAPQKSPEQNLVLIPVLGKGEAALAGQAIQLTFMTGMGAFELSRPVRLPAQN